MGALEIFQGPITCPACKSTHMFIGKDGDDHFAFCAESQCLKDDCEASKSKDQAKREAQKEKNEKGFIITGAEKFRLGTVFQSACLAKWIAN